VAGELYVVDGKWRNMEYVVLGYQASIVILGALLTCAG
jgi:hypothetical protein